MSISEKYSPVTIEGITYDLSHLDAFRADFPGKGKEGEDLQVDVKFSTHVFTERATHGRRRDIQDQSGTWRTFCSDRYSVSLLVPDIITGLISDDEHTAISKDFNKGSNLVVVRGHDGKDWSVFFCFEPSVQGVQLLVLSVYEKTGNLFHHAKFNKVSYFARQCLFSGKRIP
ncbi:hypothetical protein K3X41_09605 [Aliiroseovarius crassostreae]|uniref:hypothetical protein n=1 Tax=Aliiroseovarius crassostreae TaxID=154981 RepID=UPI00220F3B18|nr:hypothetical protein [Aliiroseovarius crassostreae]UWQ10184.1 hypothetical protein K3X41_09605 [Aliiroseovarius crassostreae]